jgi:hypothetical protein
MTKKDYELIAGVINPLVEGLEVLTKVKPEAYTHISVVRELVNNLSTKLETENPRFDRIKFWQACGL